MTDTMVRPSIVELVGPAGAGKSTLLDVLAEDPAIHAGLALWGLPRHLLVASALALVPTILAAALTGHPLRAAEVAQMVRLEALRRAVRLAVRHERRLLLMDEGPVFGLSWLEVFCAPNGDALRAGWRRRALADWAGRLDTIVRLDADDDVLARRIRHRAKPHSHKHRSPQEIAGFTARFRRAFDRVVTDIQAGGHARVLRMQTDCGNTEDHAAALRAALREAPGER